MGQRVREIAKGVGYLPVSIANVYFVEAANGHWVLVDAGTPGKAAMIRAAAEGRYGLGAKPAAMFLTHGHFDHAGSALELAAAWDVPVYAHRLELPYLTGKPPIRRRIPPRPGSCPFSAVSSAPSLLTWAAGCGHSHRRDRCPVSRSGNGITHRVTRQGMFHFSVPVMGRC